MRTSKLLLGFLGVAALASCGTNTSTDTDAAVNAQSDGPVLYPLSPGTYCYQISAIAPGYVDDCKIGVETLVGEAYPGVYDSTTGIFTLGNDGSFGSGLLSHNAGTLTRVGDPSAPGIAGCTWHQTDQTMLVMIGQNEFTTSVTEIQTNIAPACGAGSTCTSSWQWTFAINASKLVANGCN